MVKVYASKYVPGSSHSIFFLCATHLIVIPFSGPFIVWARSYTCSVASHLPHPRSSYDSHKLRCPGQLSFWNARSANIIKHIERYVLTKTKKKKSTYSVQVFSKGILYSNCFMSLRKRLPEVVLWWMHFLLYTIGVCSRGNFIISITASYKL